jgi:hypothetical protein
MPGRERGADCRGEQEGQAPAFALIPRADQALSVLNHLGIRRAPGSGLSLGLRIPFGLNPAAIKTYRAIVANRDESQREAESDAEPVSPFGRSAGCSAVAWRSIAGPR